METKGRLVQGVYHTWSTPDDLLDGTRKMVIRKDDLWIVTLPKAGTTWTQEVISLLLNDCNAELADVQPIAKRFLFVDFIEDSISPYKIAADMASPRLMKTHFQSHQMPEELLSKRSKLRTIVYVGRNPKDNAVSLFHFHRAVGELQKFEDWNEFYDAFVAGHVHGGSWFDMNLYWWGRRNDDNVLFLKYEDMKRDLKSVVVQIAKFLGCEIPTGGIEKILCHCSFSSMKNNPMTNYSESTAIRQDISPFIRKGVVGDWKNYFTVAQNQAFDKIYFEKLKGSGLVFDFEM